MQIRSLMENVAAFADGVLNSESDHESSPDTRLPNADSPSQNTTTGLSNITDYAPKTLITAGSLVGSSAGWLGKNVIDSTKWGLTQMNTTISDRMAQRESAYTSPQINNIVEFGYDDYEVLQTEVQPLIDPKSPLMDVNYSFLNIRYPIIDPYQHILIPLVDSLPASDECEEKVCESCVIYRDENSMNILEIQKLQNLLEETSNGAYLYKVEANRLSEELAITLRKFKGLQEEYKSTILLKDRITSETKNHTQQYDTRIKDYELQLSQQIAERFDAEKRMESWKNKYEEANSNLKDRNFKFEQLSDLNQLLQSELRELRVEYSGYMDNSNPNNSDPTNDEYLETMRLENDQLQAEVDGLTCALQEHEGTVIQLSGTIGSQANTIKKLEMESVQIKDKLDIFTKREIATKTERDSYEQLWADSKSVYEDELKKKTVVIDDLQAGMKKLLSRLHNNKEFEDDLVNVKDLRGRINAIIQSNSTPQLSDPTTRKIQEIIRSALRVSPYEARQWGISSSENSDKYNITGTYVEVNENRNS